MKKLITIILALCIIGFSVHTAFAQNSQSYELCDPVTDVTYQINYNSEKLTVEYNGTTLGQTTIQKVVGVSVYNNILYIYDADSLNHSVLLYCFDFYNDSINSFAINKDAFVNSYCFAASNSDTIYFVSGSDRKKLCIYENGILDEIDMKAQIKQILCLNQSLMIITTMDTFLYSDGEISIADSSPSAPVKYTGNSIIEDSQGKIYIYEYNNIIEKPEETIAPTADATDESVNTSDIESDFYIAYLGETVSKIKKAFADCKITEIRKANGKIIESGKVGTGSTITFESGKVITVIIYGEVTGEGNINSRDLKAVLNHLSGKELLNGAFLISADVDFDGVVTTKDALFIAKQY